MTELYTDHYFHTGRAHVTSGKPCQDYALTGKHNNVAFAVVSDGCSTGRHTDVGARILTWTLIAAIREYKVNNCSDPNDISDEINLYQRMFSGGVRNILGLEYRDMLATCLYAYFTPNIGLVNIRGDGAVAWKEKSGDIIMLRFEWDNNTPFYPAYAEDYYEGFIQAHGGDPSAHCFLKEQWIYSPAGGYEQLRSNYLELSEGIKGVNIPFSSEYIYNNVEFIAIFSDGVSQVEGYDWKDVIVQLLSFKNTKGEFAKRRMIRFIKDSQKTGKGPLDDIAYGVIRIDSSSQETQDET